MTIASLFGLSTAEGLVVLFVLLPFAAAAVIVPLVVWRSSKGPKPVLTRDILAHGVPGRARIVAVKPMGSVVELRPMVRFVLEVTDPGPEPFELEVVQSLPRAVIGRFRPGDTVDVRLTPDRAAGAVVWADQAAGR